MRLAPLALLALVLLFPACTSTQQRARSRPVVTQPPVEATCHYQPDILPDPACTPGVTYAPVSQQTITSTICVSGWTATIRPSTNYTTPLKVEQMAAYGAASLSPAAFEEDHRIPLAVGGDPTQVANLWPEPWAGPHGAHTKDAIEVAVHRDVCSGRLTLAQGRTVFLGDWWNYLAAATRAGPLTSDDEGG